MRTDVGGPGVAKESKVMDQGKYRGDTGDWGHACLLHGISGNNVWVT